MIHGRVGFHPGGVAGVRKKDAGDGLPPRQKDMKQSDATNGRSYSKGSTLMIEAPRLLPTQNVGGVVLLSTNTRRTLV